MDPLETPEFKQYNVTLRDSEGNEKTFVYDEKSGSSILRASFVRDLEIEKENQQALESEEENPTIQEKLNLPHSCQTAICGSCLGKVVDGELVQGGGSSLDSSKHEEGYYLLCHSKPTSDCVIETHKKSDLYV